MADPIRLYAEYIIDAPDEWSPEFTRSELLPMARAYIECDALKAALREVKQAALEREIELVTDRKRLRDALRSEVAKRHYRKDGKVLTEEQLDRLVEDALTYEESA